MSTISIAMATYNGARFIREQLDSLAAQTLVPTELVVTDDGSTDDTLSIIAQFARTAPFPVHLHRNEGRLGWRANFMKAGQLCRSDLIAFCDQDDVWMPEKLGTCSEPLTESAVTLVHHGADLMDDQGRVYGSLAGDPDVVRRPRLTWNPLWHNPLGFTMVFRRRLLAFSNAWSTSLDKATGTTPAAHDQWIYFLAGALGDTVALPTRLVRYRQHATNAVGWSKTTLDAPATGRSHAGPQASHVLSLAMSRLISLREIAGAGSLHERKTIDQAIASLETYIGFWDCSGALHRERTLRRRAALYLRLIRGGAYGFGRSWPLGRKKMIEDLVQVFRPTFC